MIDRSLNSREVEDQIIHVMKHGIQLQFENLCKKTEGCFTQKVMKNLVSGAVIASFKLVFLQFGLVYHSLAFNSQRALLDVSLPQLPS